MSFLQEFKTFAMRGNVVDLAVGFVLGAAFGKIVSSLVADVIMPPIGMLLGGVDFSSLAITLNEGTAGRAPVLIKYGIFLNTIIDFIIISLAIFLLVKLMNKMWSKAPKAELTTKKCPECQMEIPLGAKKCGHCTSTVA